MGMAQKPRALSQPQPEAVKAARERAGLSREQAAALVHAAGYRTWQSWELPPESGGRPINLAAWELFLLKSGQRAL